MVDTYFQGRTTQVMCNTSLGNCELIYSVRESVLQKADERNVSSIVRQLSKVEGITRINLVEQSDEISR